MRGNKMENNEAKDNKRTTYYTKDSREAVLDRVHRQRAIKAGVEWEKVDFKQLFASQVNCGICVKPMNFTTGNSDPEYVTVDHIVAFANGGTHTQDNVQLVHRKCNRTKGTN
jgi:5-methylcytosine-specific restriction endonuclease McrA